MPATLTNRCWVIRDREGGGYAREGEHGWFLVASVEHAAKFDNEPEAKLTGWAQFPTLYMETVRVKV